MALSKITCKVEPHSLIALHSIKFYDTLQVLPSTKYLILLMLLFRVRRWVGAWRRVLCFRHRGVRWRIYLDLDPCQLPTGSDGHATGILLLLLCHPLLFIFFTLMTAFIWPVSQLLWISWGYVHDLRMIIQLAIALKVCRITRFRWS